MDRQWFDQAQHKYFGRLSTNTSAGSAQVVNRKSTFVDFVKDFVNSVVTR
jgi:hypothetical protein